MTNNEHKIQRSKNDKHYKNLLKNVYYLTVAQVLVISENCFNP